MANDLAFALEAEGDLDEAFAWYEAKQPGLGGEFLTNIRNTIGRIVQQPESHRVVVKGYRRALVKRFPYAILYEYVGQTVTVFGVLHTSQDPERWQKRLP